MRYNPVLTILLALFVPYEAAASDMIIDRQTLTEPEFRPMDRPKRIPPVALQHKSEIPVAQRSVRFDYKDSSLSEDAIYILNIQVNALQSHKKAPVTLYGYAELDEADTDLEASKLARRRAEAVQDYLVHKSVDAARIKIFVVVPARDYNPPLRSGIERPARYVTTYMSPWIE